LIGRGFSRKIVPPGTTTSSGDPSLIIMDCVNLPRQLELGELIVDRIVADMRTERFPTTTISHARICCV
jgi:hypothetical protein